MRHTIAVTRRQRSLIAGERLGLVIDNILRPSLLESITREAQHRIDLGCTLNPALRGKPDEVIGSPAFERMKCSVCEWFDDAARRYRLDRMEYQLVVEAIDAGLPNFN